MKRTVYLQGQKEDPLVEHITFPTGERHIRIKELQEGDEVILVYNDPSGDIMKLGLAVDICNRAGVYKITLVMPFVPYARQDEVYVEGDPLSIEVFARFINSLNLDKVIITDPHSKVTPALIRNARIVHQHEFAVQAVMELDEYLTVPVALVAPDLGAAKKIKKLQEYILQTEGLECIIIQCDKVRNPETGVITGFKILDGNPKGHHCLMVDDIADGGFSFYGLHEVLNKEGAEGQSLYVTHGIFSKGVDTLLTKFDTIYTSDSLLPVDGVKILTLGELV